MFLNIHDMTSLNENQILLKRLVYEEGKLHTVLYGRWAKWGGRKPPESIRHHLLQKLPRSILENIPSEIKLDVSSVSSERIGVFAASVVQEKTIIGPIPGCFVNELTCGNAENSWEILDEQGTVSGYLDVENIHHGSWMGLIQCARYSEEQNLEKIQEGRDVFYKAVKDIEIGEEFLVWYSVQVPQYLGIPYFEFHVQKNIEVRDEMENSKPLPVSIHEDEDKKKVTCVLCHKGFNSRSNLRSHMRIHTQQKPFKCATCGRKFSQSSTLRNHIRLHTGEKPYKCNTCHYSYSQLAGLRAHQKSSQHRPKETAETPRK